MKKILIISPSNEGTIAKCTAGIYTALRECEGVKVQMLSLYRFKKGESEFLDCDCIVDRTSDESNDLSLYQKICFLKKYKSSFEPDTTVSTLGAVSLLSALSGGKDVKIGIFHAPRHQAREKGFLYYILTQIMYFIIFPFLDRYYCVSKETEEDMKHIPTIPNNKIKVVYNIHNSERIIKLASESLEANEVNLFQKLVLLYCGRLDENKAPIRAIDAFTRAKLQDANLVFIGPDPYQMWYELEKKIPAEFKSRIFYLGSKQNPYKYMSRSRMLVSTSYSEGLPGVLIESLLLGVPVVTTNSSQGNWEILSSHDKYNRKLSDFFVTDDGVITSNLSFVNKENYKIDIENLAKGMECVFNNQPKVSFHFKECISKENIVTKYIN